MKIENDKIDEKSSLDRRQFIKKTLFSIPILRSVYKELHADRETGC